MYDLFGSITCKYSPERQSTKQLFEKSGLSRLNVHPVCFATSSVQYTGHTNWPDKLEPPVDLVVSFNSSTSS